LGLGAAGFVLLLAVACEATRPVEEPVQPAPATATPSREPASIRLDDEAIRRAGIRVASVSEGALEPEVEAYGRVLDPTPAGDAVASFQAASVAAEAAERELRRVETLARADQNASMREVENARTGAARARADLAMAESRLVGSLGTALARSPELTSLAGRLVRREMALARIDVPGSSARPLPEQGAHLTVYPTRDGELVSRFVGPAPDSNPSLPGYGFLFLITDAAPPVGTPLHARLRSAGQAVTGVSLPPEAVVWHDGHVFVFVALGRGVFERRAITAQVLADGTRFVSEGLSAGEQVVVSGAAELLSAEILPTGPSES
jgi:hypothetical protein